VSQLNLQLGVKTDPVQYRYSYPWLFERLAKLDVTHIQLGTFFEMYQLPDTFFQQLREHAEQAGVTIDSTFTAHRELGGFFRSEPGFELVARKNFERYIEAGAMLGAKSIGSNPGAVLRDQMETKDAGVKCYIKHMKELMFFAKEKGIEWLTIEPMSCLAEPPTLPDEMREMGEELVAHHQANRDSTTQVGYCTDIAHGYADSEGNVIETHIDLLKASFPWLYEIHLKNTDAMFDSTFGFNEEERAKGIVDAGEIKQILLDGADQIPVDTLGCYLEIGGPKLGRDYSDHQLEKTLTDSLVYLKQFFG
jgi:hypothetical protein